MAMSRRTHKGPKEQRGTIPRQNARVRRVRVLSLSGVSVLEPPREPKEQREVNTNVNGT